MLVAWFLWLSCDFVVRSITRENCLLKGFQNCFASLSPRIKLNAYRRKYRKNSNLSAFK